MSICELEDALGIEHKYSVDCPQGDCDTCPLGLDAETCESLYEDWLIDQVAKKDYLDQGGD